MFEHVLSIAITLFILMNPIGNVPLYSKILANFTEGKKTKIIIRELLIALLVMIFCIFAGKYFFSLLAIKEFSVLISGSVILFIIAMGLVFPKNEKNQLYLTKDVEPLIVPLAIPFLADPALLASLIHYAHHKDYVILFSGLLIAWSLSFLILLFSGKLKKLFGTNGIDVTERLMGLILILMSIQLFFDGLAERALSFSS